MRLTSFALTLALLLPGLPAAAESFAVPVYGNWCGMHWGEGEALDVLDDLCRWHDLCIDDRGPNDCACDIAFMEALQSTGYPDPLMARRARAVFDGIAFVPCREVAGNGRKYEMAFAAWSEGVGSGAERPWDVFARLGALFATAPRAAD